jgi:signal transduction histidine kinase
MSLFDQLSAISDTAREISHGLHPSQLERLGLAISLKRLCSELGREKSLFIRLTVGDLPERLEPATCLCLYRVTQEAVHNILTHSQANKAEISLKEVTGRLWLEIVDDGVGFDPGREATPGLGLVSMRERVRSVGGSIDVISSPMKGTRIEVRVPLRGIASSEVSGAA